jgi:hypothetical protein
LICFSLAAAAVVVRIWVAAVVADEFYIKPD